MFITFVPANASVIADQSKIHEQAMQAFLQKDYRKALEGFLRIENNTSKHYYNIAVCYYRLNKFHDARQAFEKAATDKNMQALAYYNLALVAAKLEQPSQVVHWINRLNQSNPNPKLKTLGDILLTRIVGTESLARWQGKLIVGTGSDDNVLLVADTTTEASSISDNFKQVQALLSFIYPNKNGSWNLSLGALQHNYLTDSQYDSSDLFVRTNRQFWNSGGNWIELEASMYEASLAGAAFSRTIELSSEWQSKHRQQKFGLRSRIAYAEVKSQDVDYVGIDGQRERLDIVAEREIARHFLSVAYQYELNQRELDVYSPVRHKISVGTAWGLLKSLDFQLGLQWRDSKYPNLHTDQRWRVETSFTWRAINDWRLNMNLRHTENKSDDQIYDYKQNEAEVLLSWSF